MSMAVGFIVIILRKILGTLDCLQNDRLEKTVRYSDPEMVGI